jgi:hypothetical protein
VSFAHFCIFCCVNVDVSSFSDLEGEQDDWSRRHAPLVFQHATFPLSLQAAVTEVLATRAAKEAQRREEEEARAGKNKRTKRKGAPEAEAPKIASSFSVAATSPAAASSAAVAAAASAAPASLSSYVSRLAKGSRQLSGLAATLKHVRKQAAASAAQAAPPVSTRAHGSAAGSGSSRRQVPYAADASSSLSASSSTTHSSLSATAPLLSPGAVVGNLDQFHPKVTKEFIQAHEKVRHEPTAKKQRIGANAVPAF